MHKAISIQVLTLVTAVGLAAASHAAEWGSLKGRFLVDGDAPKPTPINITKDPEYCGKHNLMTDSVVVGKNHELANAVVYLRVGLGKKIEIHPDYEAKFKQPVELDNHFCMFSPHIVLLRLNQTLTIKNSDPPPIGHNTKIELFSFNQTIASKGQIQIQDTKDFALPMPIECSIHPWMKAHVVSQNHPYMAASAADGTFEIKNIPAGTNEFQLWHEACGFLKNLKFKGGPADLRGRVKINIPAGQTVDLGDLKVPASMLKP